MTPDLSKTALDVDPELPDSAALGCARIIVVGRNGREPDPAQAGQTDGVRGEIDAEVQPGTGRRDDSRGQGRPARSGQLRCRAVHRVGQLAQLLGKHLSNHRAVLR
ncbi:MAG: hypothetical protein M3Y33_21440 [Actinomycetota bacterium]|nr:hypothetical protein [Actinomycetota bacterium]